MELYLEDFDVRALVQDVEATIRPLVEKNENLLEVRCPADIGPIHADLTRVRQILFNLVSNAAKFTQRGRVGLEVSSIRIQGEGWIEFSVADTGIGLAPEQQRRLFQSFSQADPSTSRKYGGTGLGLVISRRFAQMMGGEISLHSEIGRGSTFTVRLPRSGGPARHASGAEPEPSSPLVLVVDDEKATRELITRGLEKEGFRLLAAGSGEDALWLAREKKPDVISLDVLMPGMDGWTVLRALKADPVTAPIPVVMVSMLDDRDIGQALGASDYLTKPFDRQKLVTALRRFRRDGKERPVLVVEDDASTREVIKRALERDGWSVNEADNGRRGLQSVARQVPDLIVLDLIMPEMDGFEFVAELRKSESGRKIPVVVVTAKEVTEEDRRRLNGQVRRVLHRARSRREARLGAAPRPRVGAQALAALREDGVDLGGELREVHGLRVVVVAARRERLLAVARHRVRGERDDRDAGPSPASALSRRVASQPSITGRLMSIRMRSGASLAAIAIACSPSTAIDDLVALALEPARQHVAVHFVVFDEQDLGHFGARPWRRSS